jgi:Helix-turn-helix of DDE superfamily endonuclease
MRQPTKRPSSPPGASVLFYRAALPLSRRTLNYTAGIIRRHRASIGSLWWKLNPAQQALLVLAYLRKGETFTELAAGFGGRHGDRLAVRDRDRGAARGPGAETAEGGAGREEGRVRLRGPGRDAHPDRPGHRGPPVLLGQA